MSGQVNAFAPHGPQGSRIDGFTAGVPLTIRRAQITLALLAALGYDVSADDTLEAAAFVLREFPWSDDALAHVDGSVTRATLASEADAFGCDVLLDSATSRLTRFPAAYALYLRFTTAGAVALEAGAIAGRAVAAAYSTGASLTPSTTPILLTAA